MKLSDIKQLNIPKAPGSYQFKNKAGKIIYIGKAADLRSRVYSYWRASANHTPAKEKMMKEINHVEWIETETEIEALLLESNLIKKYQPIYNIDLRDDKRFCYIKISTEDEIPGVFITRQIDKAGKYFGPFTAAGAVRETVKAIRKIWPFCTERKIKIKPCFYYQINRCLGPCGGMVEIDKYKKEVIVPIIKFLSGKKKQIIRDIEKEIKKLSVETRFIVSSDVAETQNFAFQDKEKQLRHLKYKLLNMQKVLEHTNILSVAEKYAADVVELAKVLGLPKVPERIEGYDISNIFGQEAVGSMVVFKNGEPDKSEYRKFKIRVGQGEANDIKMTREVLERRFKHTKKEAKLPIGSLASQGISFLWPLPDLIIIDGGKGQLNGALKEIKKTGLNIPVIAVSKGAGLRSAAAPDKIFFPGEKKPLELSLSSPALHIIKRVRDEAHRFAIKYHRLLRKKKLFKK
ncbi:GIY-YIG nuclease family protein [Candidatus Parcubacteria bacterium]|nr:GIY-YIG nuclease family protein [Candidatus Parcubacteria bacterium]